MKDIVSVILVLIGFFGMLAAFSWFGSMELGVTLYVIATLAIGSFCFSLGIWYKSHY